MWIYQLQKKVPDGYIGFIGMQWEDISVAVQCAVGAECGYISCSKMYQMDISVAVGCSGKIYQLHDQKEEVQQLQHVRDPIHHHLPGK